jgi:hypothetical protein
MAACKLPPAIKTCDQMKPVNLLIALLVLFTGALWAQDTLSVCKTDTSRSGIHIPMLTGNGFINFEKMSDENSPVLHGALYPILIWKISNKFFFENETDIAFEENALKIDIEYATLHYEVNKFVSIGAGKFLSPFGAFQERIHPSWINKFAEAPLGLGHEGIMVGPMAEVGVELRGGSALGSSKINYGAYISNGPALVTGTGDSMMTGMLEYGNLEDNNNNKAVGGRLGFLPFSNSSLEVGISRQDARVGNKNDSLFSKAKSVMHAFDLSYVKNIPSWKGILDIKGQLNHVLIDKTDSSTADMNTMSNSTGMLSISESYFLQCSFRPALLKKKILHNCEMALRYSAATVSDKGMSSQNVTQISLGLNYWLNWRTVLKFNYQMSREKAKEDQSAFLVQLAVGNPHISFKKKKGKEENK